MLREYWFVSQIFCTRLFTVFTCQLVLPSGYNKLKVEVFISNGGIVTHIDRNNRVLLIINCLAKHGDSRFHRLYQFIETAGVSVARRYLGSHYRLISVLKDNRATKDGFLSLLINLASDQRNQSIDLFFQLHGLEGKARFYDQWILSSHLKKDIRQAVKRDCLRLVYNTSCYGDSHSADFLESGFMVSVGPLKVNANAATEYPVFCRLWPGKGFRSSREISLAEVFRRADRPLPRLIQDHIAGHYIDHVDSKKIIRGESAITINTECSWYKGA